MSEPGQKGKASVVLRAVPRSFVSLRLGAGDVAADVGRAANLVLPSAAGAYTSFEDRAAYWIAPDEWLLALADDEAELARLLQQLEGRAAAVDVTGGQRLFNLAGEFAAGNGDKGFTAAGCSQQAGKTKVQSTHDKTSPKFPPILRQGKAIA